MAEADKQSFTRSEKQELATLWAESVEKTQDRQIQALIGGLNFRINIAKAFKAARITAQIYFTSKKIILTGITSPTEVMGIAADVYNLVVTTLNALGERMHPLEYTACVVLSSSPDGMTEQAFEQQLSEFLVSGAGAELPWYLGLTRDRIQKALTAFQDEEAFADLMTLLRRNDWLLEAGGNVKFKPRHYTWGLSVLVPRQC